MRSVEQGCHPFCVVADSLPEFSCLKAYSHLLSSERTPSMAEADHQREREREVALHLIRDPLRSEEVHYPID
jgi:hypothetical protein